MSTAIGIIPARLASSRFPGKPLAPLQGMPMVGHCFHRTRLAPGISAAYVATCDGEIAGYIRSIGGTAIMTSSAHTRATTRTAEAVNLLIQSHRAEPDIVVMVQGDEPLIRPATISTVLPPFADPSTQIVNLMSRLRTEEQFRDKNNVKVVADCRGNALYYSREPIPSPWRGVDASRMFMQTGIIAFRRQALLDFNEAAETPLERIESVDMNRVLEMGMRIQMVLTEDVTIGVDTPSELAEADRLLLSDPIVRLYLRG